MLCFCTGKLLPERDYVPSAPAPGEISAAAATQFPFELTARPVESIPQARRSSMPTEAVCKSLLWVAKLVRAEQHV